MQYEERYFETNGELKKIAIPSRGGHEEQEQSEPVCPPTISERISSIGKGLFIGASTFLVVELVAYSSLYSLSGFTIGFLLAVLGLCLVIGCDYALPAWRMQEEERNIAAYFNWYKETSDLLDTEATYRTIKKTKHRRSSLEWD